MALHTQSGNFTMPVSLEHYIRGSNGKSVSLAELCCSASIVAWMVIGQEWVEQVRGS